MSSCFPSLIVVEHEACEDPLAARRFAVHEVLGPIRIERYVVEHVFVIREVVDVVV
jgi:hypothetical protein